MKRIAIIILIGAALCVARNSLNIGLDNSDLDGWNRSDLSLHVDYATGVNYFTTWSGQIIMRVNADGSPFVSRDTK